MLGAHIEMMKPKADSRDPAIVTARQPYLLVSALAKGPRERKKGYRDDSMLRLFRYLLDQVR